MFRCSTVEDLSPRRTTSRRWTVDPVRWADDEERETERAQTQEFE